MAEIVGRVCPQCNGEGVIETLLFNGNPYISPCDECSGSGLISMSEAVDDADHAEYVDPVDHTHDAPISSATLLERLQAVLDVHRCAEDGSCAAEPHVVHPCETARAALGIEK